MENLIYGLGKVLVASFNMFWEVLWPLVLGFGLSAVIQAIVSKKALARHLGDDSLGSISRATLYGAASSSCSYAAIALARSLFRKGASFTSSMVFEIASTNLVIELGIILIVLMGWQFAAAEFFGGIVMIILLVIIFKLTLPKDLVRSAERQAEKGLAGRMEGHAQMDISSEERSLFSKFFSKQGFTSISHYFVMDWLSVWKDLLLGFLLAGVLATFIPESFWKFFFQSDNVSLAFIIGPLVGPFVAIISFVCSVGNVPLAAVLWRGGISFGGVISFIYADLIVLPILDIYRRYYGMKATIYILVTFFVTMALTGYITEFTFAALGIIPQVRVVGVLTEGIQWNYTTWLNLVFLLVSGFLVARFFKTDGLEMLKMMEISNGKKRQHQH